MLKKTLYLLFALPAMLLMAACADDFPSGDFVIGEGEAVVSATVDFHPLVVTENEAGSRGSEGNLMSEIRNLTLFVYDSEGNLLDILNQDELLDYKVVGKDSPSGGNNTDMPNDAGGKPVQGEKTTTRATFTIPKMKFGRYYIYCAANLADPITDTPANRNRFRHPDALRNIELTWSQTDVAANDQMFGYMTNDGNDTNTSSGFDAPQIFVNQTHVKLHSWLKRAASKVTVVYDGSGLHDNIWIYVKSVTIKDIPRHCALGSESRIADKADMITDGQVIYYDNNGALPEGSAPGATSDTWLAISNGTGKQGAVDVVDGETVEHSEYAQSLFFYENMQGNYADNANKKYYDKRPDWDNVGWVPSEGEYDFKDNVPLGTYIEVEAYYMSTNTAQVSQGIIKYRFMLGLDDTYDYNAMRNHHYKVTLGFKGYANQPDWHIDYVEPPKTVYLDPVYNISYAYNHRAIFPIRLIGDVQDLDVEIVENNWAPYDPSDPDSVPPQTVKSTSIYEKDFQWNRPVYMGTVSGTVADRNYYSLQSPKSRNGQTDVTYAEPEAPKKVTPIWAGFLALQVPDKLDATLLSGENYANGRQKLKDYYYNNHQNYRTFTKENFTFSSWAAGKSVTTTVGSGNNACEITKAADGSITVNLPMWTRPKSMLGVSGFTGNNPYDTYERKAQVRITVGFAGGAKVVKYMPVFQVRRIVNPKAVWRRWNDNTPFDVKIMRRINAASGDFEVPHSKGQWTAVVKTVSPGDEGFVYLTGGQAAITNGVMGETDSPIEFRINFAGTGEERRSKCALIEVRYHGLTCGHTIFVRQGYDEPLAIVGSTKWSSYSLYSCTVDGVTPAFQTVWGGSNYVHAVITASPLSLGTLFKRGNYDGILIKNNITYGIDQAPGANGLFEMSSGAKLPWTRINGLPYSSTYDGWSATPFTPADNIRNTFEWARFIIKKSIGERKYRVPTSSEYTQLLQGDYGIGVLYGDGATTTADNVNDAYGFEDFNNNGYDNIPPGSKVASRGMRGFIVYNPSNAHQIFFPIGARGMGMRTIQDFPGLQWDKFGILRYSSTQQYLTQGQSPNNCFRPIPYNMPGAPGAIYWTNKCNAGGAQSWDMNYFDMNFNEYSWAVSKPLPTTGDTIYSDPGAIYGGNALPIKLVLE